MNQDYREATGLDHPAQRYMSEGELKLERWCASNQPKRLALIALVIALAALFLLVVPAGAAPISTVVVWENLDAAAWRVTEDDPWAWFAEHQQQHFVYDAPYQVLLDPTPGTTLAVLELRVEGVPVPLRFAISNDYGLDKPVVLTFHPWVPPVYEPPVSPPITEPPPVLPPITDPVDPQPAEIPEPGTWALVGLGLFWIAKRKRGKDCRHVHFQK